MVNDSEQTTDTGTVTQFEKNRFFDGKLMTARDMQTEQAYHANRLELLTRHLIGSGIVRGLNITRIEADGDEIAVTISSGFAIDGSGRPIVVETETTKRIPGPDGDELYLFVRFDEAPLESVPVPEADSPSTETTANRLLEVFELTYRETEPTLDGVSAVDLGSENPGGGQRITDASQDRSQSTANTADDGAVYIGGFEQTPDGHWRQSEEALRPQYLYAQNRLSATVSEHLTDTDNPHETDVETESPEPDLDFEELEGIHERVDYLQSELTGLKNRQQTATTHLTRKVLETTVRLFRSTADQFADHSGPVSKTAREIADQAATGRSTATYSDPDQYLQTVRGLLPLLVELGEQLTGVARKTTVETYLTTVEKLKSTLESDQPAFEAAIALDRVAEATVDLEVVYTAVAAE